MPNHFPMQNIEKAEITNSHAGSWNGLAPGVPLESQKRVVVRSGG